MTETLTPPQIGGTSDSFVTFDFAELSPRERYKLLIGAVVPRPIALVTTVDGRGVVNAAPFSFFNCLSADPAIVALGVEYRPAGGQKDTGRNIRETLAFTVNIVSDALVEGMNICATPFEPGVDELAEAGLTAMPGVKVPCPWIGQAPAAFECRHHTTLGIGNSREIILGEVVYAHFRADTINQHLHVDPLALDAIGRMGGHGYATTRDCFDLPTMSVATFASDPKSANRRL
ncbi:flavin reductase family protein [Bosea sp. PAMC 26642]|uniref:flavin reductase family protein n=1 Tax=Bosea sp. (strain PAMC 26642) TaxID=1792307 RepID=UPI00076FE95A|nr:flavin reductase family protein [Bosea sp. PAMC 26642]AMJ62889.1 flavin reductase [Bosea sp. PAMC 26642]